MARMRNQLMAKKYSATQWRELIDDWIFSTTHREIVKDWLLNGMTEEEVAEKYGYSVRNIFKILAWAFVRLVDL